VPPDGPKDLSKRNSGNKPSAGEVYLEFHVIGTSVKVSAVHAKTGIEVSISGPSTTDRRILERNALNKLKYVMNKK